MSNTARNMTVPVLWQSAPVFEGSTMRKLQLRMEEILHWHDCMILCFKSSHQLFVTLSPTHPPTVPPLEIDTVRELGLQLVTPCREESQTIYIDELLTISPCHSR